jgi:hypothetical protein
MSHRRTWNLPLNMISAGRIASDLRLLHGNKYQLVIRIARQSLIDNPKKLFDIFDFFFRYSSGRKTAVVDFHFITLVAKKNELTDTAALEVFTILDAHRRYTPGYLDACPQNFYGFMKVKGKDVPAIINQITPIILNPELANLHK